MKRQIKNFFCQRLINKLIPYILVPIYYFLRLTWRIKESGDEMVLAKYVQTKNPKSCIYSFWHGDELVLIGYYAFRSLGVLSSLSRDGEVMAKVLALLGYKVYRGSSSRGGSRGLINLIRWVRKGNQAAIAVDGPKGPIYKVKPGVIELAAQCRMPIVPVRTFTKSAWSIPKAWNKSYVPKPFSRVTVVYGKPVFVQKLAITGEQKKLWLQEHCTLIEQKLNQIEPISDH